MIGSVVYMRGGALAEVSATLARVQKLSPRPLSDSDRDRSLFVGRKRELEVAVRAVRRGMNVLVLGPRGSGRTSFLHACAHQLRRERVPYMWLGAALAESPLELLDRLAFELDSPREEYVPSPLMQAMEVSSFMGKRRVAGAPDGVLRAIRRLRRKLEEKGDDGPHIVVVDDPDPEIVHTLFGRARDELWALPVVWMVSGDSIRSGDLTKPPADAFFGRVIQLSTLSEEDAILLLSLRAGAEINREMLTRAVEQAQGNPRALIQLVSDALLDRELCEEGSCSPDASGAEKLAGLTPAARRLWDALLPMGQASATDELLLRQLGWSRQRAGQVFHQLQQAGLVETAQERVEQGRPRKVYRVVKQGLR
jgi:AAA ATPase domain